MKTLKIYGNTLDLTKGIKDQPHSGLFDTVIWIYNDGYRFGLRQGDAICHYNHIFEEFSMFSNTKIGISYIDEVVKKLEQEPHFYKKTKDEENLIVFEEINFNK